MKFGGTSVADAEAIGRLLSIVTATMRTLDVPPVVVVSATSGTTDQLLALASDAQRGSDGVDAGVDRVLAAAPRPGERAHHGRARRPRSQPSITRDLEDLRAVLTAISILRESSPRSLDAVAAVGEIVSSRIVAAAFEEASVPAAWVDARRALVTDDQHTAALPLALETRAAVEREIVPHLLDGRVPVLGGLRRQHVVRCHDHARSRRIGLLGGADGRGRARAAQVRAARGWRVARFRSGPTWTAC